MRKTTTNRLLRGAAVVTFVAGLTGCQGEEGTPIGPRGGIVSSEDGHFSIEIPGGALIEEVDITIEEIDCELPADAVDTCYEVGPVGMPLLRPATVTYDVGKDMFDIVEAEALAVFSEREEHWDALADREVEVERGVVVASAVYLSAYALVATD